MRIYYIDLDEPNHMSVYNSKDGKYSGYKIREGRPEYVKKGGEKREIDEYKI